MIKTKLLFLTIALLLLPQYVTAAPIETFQFESEETERVFHKLSEELRCLVCQNQSIAESNADLAKDLRLEMYSMLSEGKSEQEIVDFMVQRYGDYVLYRPPFKPLTWLLWIGPVIIFVIGLIFVVRYVRSQRTAAEDVAMSEADIERIKNLHAEQQGKIK